MITKICNIRGEWKTVFISDEEEKEIRLKHRDDCNELFKECLKDAKVILGTNTDLPAIEVASALFERRSDAIFSILQRELDNFIYKLKQEAS